MVLFVNAIIIDYTLLPLNLLLWYHQKPKRTIMDPILRPLAKRIRDLRKAKGLSQEAVAEKAHIHPTFLSQIERAVAAPTVITLSKIASALGVAPMELLAEKASSLPHTKKELQIMEVANLLRKQSPRTIRTARSLIKELIKGLPS
jgi:transcriptional regulator with XRE-family HTH domain